MLCQECLLIIKEDETDEKFKKSEFSCSKCKANFHKKCLFFPDFILKQNNIKLCDKCLYYFSGMKCIICMKENGILHKLLIFNQNKNKFIHNECAKWFNKIHFFNDEKLFTRIFNYTYKTFDKKDIFFNTCSKCKEKKKSFLIKCFINNCNCFIHHSCVYKQPENIYFNQRENKLFFYCDEHKNLITNSNISNDDFFKKFLILRKETFLFLLKLKEQKEQKNQLNKHIICDICLKEIYEENKIFKCTVCGFYVHLKCFLKIYSSSKDFINANQICYRCHNMLDNKHKTKCFICNKKDGTFFGHKKGFIHFLCAKVFPNYFKFDYEKKIFIDKFNENNQFDKKFEICSICKQNTFFYLKCEKCKKIFHPYCAYLTMHLKSQQENYNIYDTYFVCVEHKEPFFLKIQNSELIMINNKIDANDFSIFINYDNNNNNNIFNKEDEKLNKLVTIFNYKFLNDKINNNNNNNIDLDILSKINKKRGKNKVIIFNINELNKLFFYDFNEKDVQTLFNININEFNNNNNLNEEENDENINKDNNNLNNSPIFKNCLIVRFDTELNKNYVIFDKTRLIEDFNNNNNINKYLNKKRKNLSNNHNININNNINSEKNSPQKNNNENEKNLLIKKLLFINSFVPDDLTNYLLDIENKYDFTKFGDGEYFITKLLNIKEHMLEDIINSSNKIKKKNIPENFNFYKQFFDFQKKIKSKEYLNISLKIKSESSYLNFIEKISNGFNINKTYHILFEHLLITEHTENLHINQEDIYKEHLNIKKEKVQKFYKDESNCCICFDLADDDYRYYKIIYCDKCGLSIHPNCYGLETVPNEFYCDKCKIAPNLKIKCFLCQNENGALKYCKILNSWAHVTCVLFSDNFMFENYYKLNNIIFKDEKIIVNNDKKCEICNNFKGDLFKCKCCGKFYHFFCFYFMGGELFIKKKKNVDGYFGNVKLKPKLIKCNDEKMNFDRKEIRLVMFQKVKIKKIK